MRKLPIKLQIKKELEIKNTLSTLLADLKNPNDMSEFLDSFLTKNEYLSLGKRITVIKHLANNRSFDFIKKDLLLSSKLISEASSFKNDKILAKVIQKIEIDDWATKLSKKIIKIFSFK